MTGKADTPAGILARYAEGPQQLESALKGLAEADLDLALSKSFWSIRQIVHHLADGDDIWKLCIKMALGNPEGLFDLRWYWEKEQIEWGERWNYAGRSVATSLALLKANRRHILDLVQPIRETWGISVRLVQPEGPEVRITIGEVIEMQARHISNHIQDIEAIRLAHPERASEECE